MITDEVTFNKTIPILLVEILIYKGLFPPKTSKHGSNSSEQLSMVSSPKLPRPKEFYFLEVES